MSKRCARAAAAVIATVALVHADPAYAYLKFGVRANDQNVTLKWAQVPVRCGPARSAPGNRISTELAPSAEGFREFDVGFVP